MMYVLRAGMLYHVPRVNREAEIVTSVKYSEAVTRCTC